MAIKLKDGTILRNLEEQVQYLTNYHDINQGLAQWGIRVVGQVEAAADLPPAATYEGEYGDAYAVGTEAPFNFYIWTRAAIVGDPGYWFPFGEISIVGPQGPQGPQGDKGDVGASTRWYVGAAYPTPADLNIGDQFLMVAPVESLLGEVYQVESSVNGNRLVRKGNIRGPQGIPGIQGPPGTDGRDGIQGPPGPQGDVGGFINIWGILANTDQLPTPASLNNPTVAYLIEHAGGSDATNDHYDLYIQVGESSSTALWTNAGPFNAATLITVNGVGLNVWNADTKLDRNTAVTQYNQLYAKSAEGGEGYLNVTKEVVGDAAVQRRSDGNIFVPINTDLSNAAISKSQADTTYIFKVTPAAGIEVYYATKEGQRSFNLGTDGILGFSGNAPVSLQYNVDETANSIVRRNNSGMVYVNVPVDESSTSFTDSTAVNKKYVNNKFLAKQTTTSGSHVYGFDPNGQKTVTYTPANAIYSIVQRREGNTFDCGTPTLPEHVANKGYVDDNSVVSLRYTFESLYNQTLLVVYLTMNKKQYGALEPYEYFINKDITSPVKGLLCFCERLGTLSTLYYDPSDDIFKCSGSPDDEYDLIQTEIM